MNRVLLYIAAATLSCGIAQSQTEKVLWSFSGPPNDGAAPTNILVSDGEGNLYGTTSDGGSNVLCAPYNEFGGCGTVFELSLQKDGTWAETILYNFCALYSGTVCTDGNTPEAGLVFDTSGNLYGTTRDGGTNFFGGTVFKLSPPKVRGGAWTETVLYNFCSLAACSDGENPWGQLIFDSSGNLYGTAQEGGSGHIPSGTVFELSPGAGGWTETVLYNFCSLGGGTGFCPDGMYPQGALVFDTFGNLYGSTPFGGADHTRGGGTVFELSPTSGTWTETVLLAFGSETKGVPFGNLALDPLGNLYGTTYSGGGHGSVFRFNLKSRTERAFFFDTTDGANPRGGVLVDSKRGMIYGTTTAASDGVTGTVFQIDSSGKESILYQFCQLYNCADGQDPNSTLLEDRSGNLYGTTLYGGTGGLYGAVFEVSP